MMGYALGSQVLSSQKSTTAKSRGEDDDDEGEDSDEDSETKSYRLMKQDFEKKEKEYLRRINTMQKEKQ
jgi:hypothetical protein